MTLMTLKECLSSFYDRFGQPKGKDAECRKALAAYIGADYQSLMRWLKTDNEPTGERRWRMITFFYATGYPIVDYTALDEVFQNTCRLLTHGVADANEISLAFGFTGKDTVGSMNKVLYGKQGFPDRKVKKLTKFVRERQVALDAAEAQFLTDFAHFQYQDAAESIHETAVVQTVAVTSTPQSVMEMAPEEVATQLALLVQIALPYAQFLESDACTPVHRAQLRELSGRKGVFKLANSLNRLCGERVRNESKGDS